MELAIAILTLLASALVLFASGDKTVDAERAARALSSRRHP